MVIHPLRKERIILLLNRRQFSWCKCRELQAVQHRQKETSRRFYDIFLILIVALSAICFLNAKT